jgi:peptidoglycan/LPS O-acetylase OafA/YrhL
MAARENRRPNLDGLRALAVLLVLLHHTSNNVSNDNVFFNFMQTGWNGIHLFFILSGYFIGNILLREVRRTGDLSLTTFWARRGLRTWPVYYVVLLFQIWRTHPSWSTLWPYTVFLQNYTSRPIYSVTWSIAVQEQFYLVLPLLILSITWFKTLRHQTSYLLLSCIACGFAGIWWQGNSTQIGALAPLAAGVLLAELELNGHRSVQWIKNHPNLAFLCGLGLCYLPFFATNDKTIWQWFQVFGFFVISAAALGKGLFANRVLDSTLALWVAEVSYSTYLIQDRPLFRVHQLTEYLGLTGAAAFWFTIGASIVATFLCGAVVFYICEKPFMKLRNRLFPSRVAVYREPLVATSSSAA